jgi:restriction system protein
MAGRPGGPWKTPVRFRFRDALSELDPLEFERLLGDYYRAQGFQVDQCGTGGRASRFDGGVDLRLRKDGRLTLVQCKRDTVFQTTHNVVHELLGVMTTEGADAAIVVTSGEFTDAAKQAGSRGNVQLIDGMEVRRLLGDRLARLPSPRTQVEPATHAWQPLQIAEERPWREKRRQAKPVGDEMLFRVVAWVVLMLFLIFVAPRLISGIFVSMAQGQPGRPASTARQPTPALPQPEWATAREQAVARELASSASVVAKQWTPPPPATSERPLTPAEQAQRDEATRRYLERVPEVTHYRYSPLEQNRDPAPAREASR